MNFPNNFVFILLCSFPLNKPHINKDQKAQRGRTTNGEIGPFMKYATVHYLLYEQLEESPNCVYMANIYR